MKTNTTLIGAVAGFSLFGFTSLANADRLGDFGEHNHFRERVELRIVNYSPATIESVYVSPVFRSSWGADRLGYGTLHRGDGVTKIAHPGRYDVKLVNANGRVCQFQIDLYQSRTIEIEGRDLWRCQLRSM